MDIALVATYFIKSIASLFFNGGGCCYIDFLYICKKEFCEKSNIVINMAAKDYDIVCGWQNAYIAKRTKTNEMSDD